MNLRVAAAAEGLDVQVNLLPASDELDWLARLLLTGKTSLLSRQAALAPLIEQRRTYRQHFLPREVDTTVLQEFIKAAEQEGACLRSLATRATRQQAASLVAEGDTA